MCLFTFYLILSISFKNTSAAAAAKLLRSCPTLCDPTGGSPPGSTVPGILQATVLEWVAIAFSKIPYTNAYIGYPQKWHR